MIAYGTGTNAPVAITLSTKEHERQHLRAVQWSYSGTPTGGNLVSTATR